jgi:hypothetical protein
MTAQSTKIVTEMPQQQLDTWRGRGAVVSSWLRTWRQIAIAELLNLLERRRYDEIF